LNEYPSKLLSEAVDQLASLPGIGRRTALRLALFLLKQDSDKVQRFGKAFIHLKEGIQYCESCFNISDDKICDICSNSSRENGIICVVEDVRDVMAIESTAQFKGKYHVLGGIISPMDGIGPDEIRVDELIDRLENNNIKEVIMALSTTMEGDTTNFYIYKRLKSFNIKVTTIARGVSIGDELEYTDEQTLGRSLTNRVPYENTLAQ